MLVKNVLILFQFQDLECSICLCKLGTVLQYLTHVNRHKPCNAIQRSQQFNCPVCLNTPSLDRVHRLKVHMESCIKELPTTSSTEKTDTFCENHHDVEVSPLHGKDGHLCEQENNISDMECDISDKELVESDPIQFSSGKMKRNYFEIPKSVQIIIQEESKTIKVLRCKISHTPFLF